MSWLQSFDLWLLQLVRDTLRNPLFDWLMPLLSANVFFVPASAIAAVLLAWKGGRRGRLCLGMMVLVVLIGDNLICGPLKEVIGRARPSAAATISGYERVAEPTTNHSMPSSHAANWFSATAVALVYYRKSLRFMLPLGLAVGYSRIYKGAHYPSDVLVGGLLGFVYGVALLWLVDAIWQHAGPRWFPLWWARSPSVLDTARPVVAGISATEKREEDSAVTEQHWVRLGYVLIGLLLFARLAYLASGQIELGIDETYQWVWSKHLALSYYSEPPIIAYAQRLGTSLWGDTAFGVRFLSPVSAAVVSFLLLRLLWREGDARAGFWLVLIFAATPLVEVGATVLTVDGLLVLFWTAAMVSGWSALKTGRPGAWLWTGLWMGLGCLSKYTAFFQPVCFGIFFVLCKEERYHLVRPWPYLAAGLMLLCTLPVWIWNAQHGWTTLTHVASNARIDRPWQPSLVYLWDFTLAETVLLNPIFFVGTLWAAVAFWHGKDQSLLTSAATGFRAGSASFSVYLFSMGAPLFLEYWLYTLHSKVQPNWITASVIPLFCLMAGYWESRSRAGVQAVKGWLAAGISIGLVAVIICHDTNLVSRITRHPLPPEADPLRQVRAWAETARAVSEARMKLLAEGHPVFIICSHYGMTGELSFYLPEAKAGVPDHPLVYFQSSDVPQNQFFFWPGYGDRKGQNAIYVVETARPQTIPERIRNEFSEVKDLGMKEILYRGRMFRRLQLFECHGLR